MQCPSPATGTRPRLPTQDPAIGLAHTCVRHETRVQRPPADPPRVRFVWRWRGGYSPARLKLGTSGSSARPQGAGSCQSPPQCLQRDHPGPDNGAEGGFVLSAVCGLGLTLCDRCGPSVRSALLGRPPPCHSRHPRGGGWMRSEALFSPPSLISHPSIPTFVLCDCCAGNTQTVLGGRDRLNPRMRHRVRSPAFLAPGSNASFTVGRRCISKGLAELVMKCDRHHPTGTATPVSGGEVRWPARPAAAFRVRPRAAILVSARDMRTS